MVPRVGTEAGCDGISPVQKGLGRNEVLSDATSCSQHVLNIVTRRRAIREKGMYGAGSLAEAEAGAVGVRLVGDQTAEALEDGIVFFPVEELHISTIQKSAPPTDVRIGRKWMREKSSPVGDKVGACNTITVNGTIHGAHCK